MRPKRVTRHTTFLRVRDYATVKARKRNKGTVYRAEVRVKGHPRLSQTFDRQSEAMRWAEDTENAFRNGGYVVNAPPNDIFFDDALKKYLAETSSKKAAFTHRRELCQSRSLHYFFGRTLEGDDGAYTRPCRLSVKKTKADTALADSRRLF